MTTTMDTLTPCRNTTLLGLPLSMILEHAQLEPFD